MSRRIWIIFHKNIAHKRAGCSATGNFALSNAYRLRCGGSGASVNGPVFVPAYNQRITTTKDIFMTTNIIRTTAVELFTIPAITYKQKLASGGAGMKLFRLDRDATAVFTIDKRTGDTIPYRTYDVELFPDEAVLEAFELTSGLPYTSRGNFKITIFTKEAFKEDNDVAETEVEKTDMVNSEEYNALIERYTNEKGKLNYTLMNKDFIQFAAKSKIVSSMVADRSQIEDVLSFIIKSRAALIAGKKDSMTDKQTEALIETLDEIDPRSAFKELTQYIKRLLSKSK